MAKRMTHLTLMDGVEREVADAGSRRAIKDMTGAYSFSFEKGSLSTSTGAEQNGGAYMNRYARTGFVPCTAGETVTISNKVVSGQTIYMICYGSDLGFKVTKTVASGAVVDYTIPDGVAYFRMRVALGLDNAVNEPLSKSEGIMVYSGGVLSGMVAETNDKIAANKDRIEMIDSKPDDTTIRLAAWRGYPCDGSVRVSPDNSWDAYNRAIEKGADILWVAAARYSKNLTWYCYHDDNINGTKLYLMTDA